MRSVVNVYLAFALVAASSLAAANDFATRCASPDVLRCIGFDDASVLSGTYGDNSGTLVGHADPAIDTNIRASGTASLMFTIPTNSPANTSGSYFTNFSDDLDVQFDGGDTFYVQWKQRFSPELLDTVYDNGFGWKQVIVGTGDKPGCNSTFNTSGSGLCYSSCSSLELVTQNLSQRGYAQMYNSCTGSTSHPAFDGFSEPFNGDFKLQNARPFPYCLWSSGSDLSESTCFGYFPNEWMTFQVGVTLGERVGDEFVGSNIKLWVAREGQPAELVIDWGPYNLTAGDPAENEQYGKVWLLPYHSDKDPAQSHVTAFTWYDELIVSRSRIPDPVPGDGSIPRAPVIADLGG